MKGAKDRMSKACDIYDPLISTKKTKAVNQLAPRKPYIEQTITVNGQTLPCRAFILTNICHKPCRAYF